MKPVKWGMKAFVLSDSKTGYVYNWRLYTGTYTKAIHKIQVMCYLVSTVNAIVHPLQCNTPHSIGKDDSLASDSCGLTHAVVLKLLEGLEHRGHHVYTDNYYSSPDLFTALRDKGFGACGTVRVDRRGMPLEMRHPLAKGEVVTASLSDSLVALKWMDKQAVLMLSTIHDTSLVVKQHRSRLARSGTVEVQKPKMVDEYNQYMGGVDKSDQLLSYYGFPHHTIK